MPGPIIPEDLAELFEGGVSLLVGTRDQNMVPEATRGVGAIVHRDRTRLTVFLPASVSHRAITNVRDNGLISVAFSSLLDHKTIQLKGKVESVRDATEAEQEIVTRYAAAFGEVLSMTGIPRAVTRTVNIWPAYAVTFEATDIFVQTPGPNAGERMSA